MNSYKEKIGLFSVFFFFLLGLIACKKQSPAKQTMTIAVAASAYDAIQAIAEVYTFESGQEVAIVRASSGKLSAQIIQSAPYALFFSADEYYPKFLEEKAVISSPVSIYAYGYLSVWLQNNTQELALIDYLKSSEVKKIALANITSAPYGKAAYRWMKKNNILADVEHKLVYGESIAQVNTYVLTHAVDAAFTNIASLAHTGSSIKKKLQQLPKEVSPALPQAMVITKFGGKHFPEQSQSFFNFAQSEKGQAILQHFGYDSP